MNKKYFDLAFEAAEKAFQENEVPIGAVIVRNDEVLSVAYNKKESDQCCISHAEMLAIKEASSKRNNWRLDDCDIYVTLDPCPMCASALKQCRIKNVYSGLNNTDFSYNKLLEMIFEKDRTNPQVNFVSNLAVERSKDLLSRFFESQRNNS